MKYAVGRCVLFMGREIGCATSTDTSRGCGIRAPRALTAWKWPAALHAVPPQCKPRKETKRRRTAITECNKCEPKWVSVWNGLRLGRFKSECQITSVKIIFWTNWDTHVLWATNFRLSSPICLIPIGLNPNVIALWHEAKFSRHRMVCQKQRIMQFRMRVSSYYHF